MRIRKEERFDIAMKDLGVEAIPAFPRRLLFDLYRQQIRSLEEILLKYEGEIRGNTLLAHYKENAEQNKQSSEI